MGAGLILIPLWILVYIPILIWSFHFYFKTEELSKKESKNFVTGIALKRTILFIYAIAVISNKNFGSVIWHALNHTIDRNWYWLEYWLKNDLKNVLLGWDDWNDISYYWASILIAYLIGYALSFVTEKLNKGSLYKYNTYSLAVFIIFIHPFIIISMLGRLLGWELIANEWLGL